MGIEGRKRGEVGERRERRRCCLASITKLDLSNNNFETIPESPTAWWVNVVELDMQSNQRKALPNSIHCLSKLKTLNISSNNLHSFPSTILNYK